jgi:cell division protease FtsH
MGGRAAEEVVYGTVTTGAENDMQQATDLARQMVTRWGMSDRIGPVTLEPPDGRFLPGTEGFTGSVPYSEATATLVDTEVQRILQDAHATGVRMLQEHRFELDALAAALVEHETLDATQILRVTGLRPTSRLESRPRVPAKNGQL